VIDLHLHTTSSDGTSSPEELVERARAVGISILAVTDHDTMAGVPPAASAASRLGLGFVPGIEVTAVHDGHDVHVLGYFLDAESSCLVALLAKLRSLRVDRAAEMAGRLAAAGARIDIASMMSASTTASPKSIARPQIARALVAAGHAADVADAFDKFLSEGRFAYVPHRGPTPADVIAVINESGGIASLAHPGTLKCDALIPALAEAGLTAIEAYHSAHDRREQAHYIGLARSLGLALSGGSDFHGAGTRRSEHFGTVGLPADEFHKLASRAASATRAGEPGLSHPC
jgi:predicted metal-dependent phosphoesterase TrpH